MEPEALWLLSVSHLSPCSSVTDGSAGDVRYVRDLCVCVCVLVRLDVKAYAL